MHQGHITTNDVSTHRTGLQKATAARSAPMDETAGLGRRAGEQKCASQVRPPTPPCRQPSHSLSLERKSSSRWISLCLDLANTSPIARCADSRPLGLSHTTVSKIILVPRGNGDERRFVLCVCVCMPQPGKQSGGSSVARPPFRADSCTRRLRRQWNVCIPRPYNHVLHPPPNHTLSQPHCQPAGVLDHGQGRPA